MTDDFCSLFERLRQTTRYKEQTEKPRRDQQIRDMAGNERDIWRRKAIEAIARAEEAQRCLREAIEAGERACYPIPSTWRKAAQS
jgi:transposase-like protein